MQPLEFYDGKDPDASTHTSKTVLEFRNLSAGYGTNTVLHGIDVSFRVGEIVAVVGESGCGKSTLVKIPGRLSEEDRFLSGTPHREATKNGGYWQHGSVMFWPNPKDPIESYDLGANGYSDLGGAQNVRRKIITMPQGDTPLAGLNVSQNILMPDASTREVVEVEEDTRRRFSEALENAALLDVMFDTLEDFENFKQTGLIKGSRLSEQPGNFSGGQQQRVSLATRFMMGGKTLIFDEGLSALDPRVQREIMGLLNDLVSKGIIDLAMVVCHSLNLVKASNRTIAMASGTIVEDGATRRILKNPQTEAMKDVIAMGQTTPKAPHKIPHRFRDQDAAIKRLKDLNT